MLITNFEIWYAHAIAAIKFGFAIANLGLCCCKIRIAWLISVPFGGYRSQLTAIEFVAAVGTLGCAGTRQMAGNAGQILALELIFAACDIPTYRQMFIVALWTIGPTIAHPALVNARETVAALKFVLQTRRWDSQCICTILRKHSLIVINSI